MRPSLLPIALCLALPGIAPAHAAPAGETAPAQGGPSAVEFDPVVVSATRTERALSDVPNSVDVIQRERMDALIVRDLKDLFRYEPGITVSEGFGRFGIGDIRIRGLGGNRVRIQTDGIAVPDAFSIGSFSSANRNFVDLDTLKRVEVVRGPTSSLYGSDALGGTVSFTTRDPADYLREGKDAYFGLKFGYEGDWDGIFGGATAAFGGPRWSGLVAVGHRQGRETENQGRNAGTDDPATPSVVEYAGRTLPNPQHRDGRSLLSKLVFAPGDDQRFRLTVEGNEDAGRTDVLTARGNVVAVPGAPATARVLSQTGDDHQTRARVSFSHEMDALEAAVADRLDWQVYRQQSETTQDTLERRVSLWGGRDVNPVLRARRFDFDQRTDGVQAHARKAFATGTVMHEVSYGIDLSRTDTRQKRDGRVTNLTTGAVSGTLSPDTFPVRDFPLSTTTQAGLYLQDEIASADGALRLVPAVRVDRYQLEPEIDAIFAANNPGVAVADVAETAVSPKLGAVWHFAPGWSLFGGYARGFRAPPYNDVNIGFTNLQFGYTALPNPDLKPETSDGLEAGVRFGGKAAYASMSAYRTRYDDLIESLVVVSQPPQTPLIVFQSQNVSRATIQGVEAKAGVELGAFAPTLEGWSLRGAAAWSRGTDETDDVPLDSVDPLTATLGMAYDRQASGAELVGRFVDRKRRVSGAGTYAQAGYGVLDLYAHWAFAPGARIDLGVRNLGDRRYSDAGNVPLLLSASSATLDRYTSPGRNLALSVSVAW